MNRVGGARVCAFARGITPDPAYVQPHNRQPEETVTSKPVSCAVNSWLPLNRQDNAWISMNTENVGSTNGDHLVALVLDVIERIGWCGW
eukprot:5346488-Alexandrium_andersonii.AAC.1